MYSPKIDEKLVPELYRLKQKIQKPMTHIVNEAIVEYLKKNTIINYKQSSIDNKK